jgi:hypothetical protein
MAGILHEKCDASALPHASATAEPAHLVGIQDGEGIDADDLDEALRTIARRRVQASTAS